MYNYRHEIFGDLDQMDNKPEDIVILNDYVIKKFPEKEIVYNSPTPVTECTNYYIVYIIIILLIGFKISI